MSRLTGDAHRTMPLRPAAHTFLVHDEKLALEAIWPQEFEWKEDAFVLTLTPAEPVDEVFASVVIQVRPCEHSYPDTVPAITVSVIRGGLTEHHVAEIERTLQSLAKTLVGEPMVHELAQQTQEWLGRNNLPETEVGRRWQLEEQARADELRADAMLVEQQRQARAQERRERRNVRREAAVVEERRLELVRQRGGQALAEKAASEEATTVAQASAAAGDALEEVNASLAAGGTQLPWGVCQHGQWVYPSEVNGGQSESDKRRPSWIESEAQRVEMEAPVEVEPPMRPLGVDELCEMVEELRRDEPSLTRKELTSRVNEAARTRACCVSRNQMEGVLRHGWYADQACVICLERTAVSERHVYELCGHPGHWACKPCHRNMARMPGPLKCPLCRKEPPRPPLGYVSTADRLRLMRLYLS